MKGNESADGQQVHGVVGVDQWSSGGAQQLWKQG